MNTTRPQNRSGRSLQLSRCPTLGLPQSLYWVLGYSKSVVVPPTLHFCSRSWLEVAHLVSCEPNWIQSEWFFFLIIFSLSLCRFLIRQGALHVPKGYLNLSFPVRKAGGSDFKTVHLLTPFFFQFRFQWFFSHHTSDKLPSSVSWPCSSPTCVALWLSDWDILPA